MYIGGHEDGTYPGFFILDTANTGNMYVIKTPSQVEVRAATPPHQPTTTPQPPHPTTTPSLHPTTRADPLARASIHTLNSHFPLALCTRTLRSHTSMHTYISLHPCRP